MSPVQAGARQQLDFAVVETGVHAIAVVLYLMQPLRTLRRLVYQRAKLWLDPPWQTASAHAIAHSECEILAIPHREVEGLMQSRPGLSAKFLWAFGRTLAGRLRDTNQRMASLLAISRAF